jgi:hypothetical protein
MRSVSWKVGVLGVAAAMCAATMAVGCSSGRASSAQRDDVGTVGMQLVLPGGLTINTLSYTVSGPNSYSGTVNVAGSSNINFGVANVAPGSGYVLSESASSADGVVTCSGTSAPFTVSSGQTTTVAVALACTASPDAGTIIGTSVATECAKWTSAFATPSQTTVGGTVQINAAATAPNPSAITFAWTASAGTIDTPNQPSANFTCPSTPGPVTLTLTVGDGAIPEGGACPAVDTTTTITVTCAAAAVDAGAPDTGSDASVSDAGPASDGSVADAGSDAAPTLVPCTAAGQTGCVACSGNSTGVCSPTEAQIVQHDIARGAASTTPCYSCLLQAGCIDDTSFGDTNHECGDLAGTFDAGPQSGTTSSTLCLNTVSCIFGSSCSSSSVSTCYCGSSTGSACQNATTTDGACVTQEVAGLGLTTSQSILQNFTDTTRPSGMANQLFQCAVSSNCAACLQ